MTIKQFNKPLINVLIFTLLIFINIGCVEKRRSIERILKKDRLFFNENDFERYFADINQNFSKKNSAFNDEIKILMPKVNEELKSRLINKYEGSFYRYGSNDTSILKNIPTDYLFRFDPFTIFSNGSKRTADIVEISDGSITDTQRKYSSSVGFMLYKREGNPKIVDFDIENHRCRCAWPYNDQKILDNRVGTGFIYKKQYFITAGHCVAYKKSVDGFEVVFNFIDTEKKPEIKTFEKGIYVYDKNKNIDFAILKLDSIEKNAIDININFNNIEKYKTKNIYMLGHPLGLKLKVTNNAIAYDVDIDKSIVYTNLDAFFYNSGSPVFSQDNEFIGILSGGNREIESEKKECSTNLPCNVNNVEKGYYPYVCDKEVCYLNKNLKRVVSSNQFYKYLIILDSLFQQLDTGELKRLY